MNPARVCGVSGEDSLVPVYLVIDWSPAFSTHTSPYILHYDMWLHVHVNHDVHVYIYTGLYHGSDLRFFTMQACMLLRSSVSYEAGF